MEGEGCEESGGFEQPPGLEYEESYGQCGNYQQGQPMVGQGNMYMQAAYANMQRQPQPRQMQPNRGRVPQNGGRGGMRGKPNQAQMQAANRQRAQQQQAQRQRGQMQRAQMQRAQMQRAQMQQAAFMQVQANMMGGQGGMGGGGGCGGGCGG